MKAVDKWLIYGVVLLLFVGFGCSDSFVDTLTSSLDINDKIKSNYLIISVRLYGAGSVLGPLIGCLMSQYLSVRVTTLFSSFIIGIGAFSLALGPPMQVFVFGMATLGIGIAMGRSMAISVLMQCRESAMIGVIYGFGSVGQTTAPFLLRLIQHFTTWKHFFWIFLAYFGFLGIVQFFVFRNFILAGSKGDVLPLKQKWRDVVADKKLWKRILSLTLSQLITETWAHWMSTYVKEVKDLHFKILSIGAFELAVYRSGATVSMLCFSHLYCRVGYKRSNLMLLWLTCIFLVSIDKVRGIAPVSVLNAFIGATLAPTMPNMWGNMSRDINPPFIETTVSLALATSTTGVIVGPLAVSFIVEDFGIDVLVGISIVMAFMASLSNIHDPLGLVKAIKTLPRKALHHSRKLKSRLEKPRALK
ncbi:hypothetical protein J056_004189 [Wallemia ichthyophaga EXF-994]|uniref:Major facilitator superfamily (MFS) profile domain-containing protein n=2 Tax=Wallemia ichthyophaga TaxID=245174 RepID=A0A4T0JJF1_WALIC|nr:uncharacterized protein J056_004189 [Wallemia ichthyophaga EXF-994]EOR01403.1 hypothetical protein J056_004189 [Wallemia ichthyophaga EXF-994]TIB42838.1 hypothetical protein E3P86_00212 [Wallemia ichthyophaga]